MRVAPACGHLAGPVAVAGREAAKVPRTGAFPSWSPLDPNIEAFQQGLREP